ncbi:MAG: hypothetical protein V2I36_16650, partial [Desulfopila sp.]|nr:hypothetical protein [Desulfopila sp.]
DVFSELVSFLQMIYYIPVKQHLRDGVSITRFKNDTVFETVERVFFFRGRIESRCIEGLHVTRR